MASDYDKNAQSVKTETQINRSWNIFRIFIAVNLWW